MIGTGGNTRPGGMGPGEEADFHDFHESLVAVLDPLSASSEAYRTLRTNLFYGVVDSPPKVIVLTSAGPGEGKSTTCANLGAVLSQANKKVLILDCDLRKPKMHEIFGLRNFQGLVNVLAKEQPPEETWHEPLRNLKVMTSGPVPPNPGDLLGSERFAELLDQMRRTFDYVLLDTSPIGVVSDPLILAPQADGVLLVLDAQRTRKNSLRRSVRNLEAVNANVLGNVMNNVNFSGRRYQRYQPYVYEQN